MNNRRNAIWLLIIVLLFIGVFTGQTIFFNVTYLLGALVFASWLWSWLAVRGVQIGRRTRTRRSQVGRQFNEQFSLGNRFFLPKLWLEVRDHSDLPSYKASQVIPPLLPRRQYDWQAETLCVVRGEFQLGPMTVISGDPFGFYMITRTIDARERMIVYPRSVPISKVQLPKGMMSGGEPQRYISQSVTTNAAGVRDYVPGDSINKVHWKSTARRGKLIVKEFEIDPLVDIWMVVDFSAASVVEAPDLKRFGKEGAVIPTGTRIPFSTEEYSVAIAASLASYFIEGERALGFAAYTPSREVYQPERGHRQLTRILEALAVARAHSHLSLRDMLALEAPQLSRGATVMLITATLDIAWIGEVTALAKRGIRPMCIYIDPHTFGGGVSDDMRGRLSLAKVPTIVIKQGEDLSLALAQRPVY